MGYCDPKKLIYARGEDADPSIEAENIRMCVKWSTKMCGVLGLAAIGPDKDCRISHAVPWMRIESVTAIVEITPKAEKAWKKEPWG